MRAVLLGSLLASQIASACIGPLPQQIKLSGTTYASTPITVKSNGFWKMEFDGDAFSYNPIKKQWCVNDTTCGISRGVTMSVGGKNVGRAEASGATLFVFSLDKSGMKDLSKPYLKITDMTKLGEPTENGGRHLSAKWNIEAFDGASKVGEYVAENDNQFINKNGEIMSTTRGLTIGSPEPGPVTDMRGNALQSSGCGAVNVSKFSKPTVRMTEGGGYGGASR